MCALGILPPLPPPTDGSVRPSARSTRPRQKAARPRAHAERGDGPEPQHYFPGGQGGSAGIAALRRRHTPPNDRLEESSASGSPSVLSPSGSPPPAKKEAQRLSPRWDGSLPESRSAPLLPELLERRGKSPVAGETPERAEGKGRSPQRGSCWRLAAPRAGPGPRRLSARLGTPGARAAVHAVGAGGAERLRRCGSGPPPPPLLLLPPVSARGGLSRPSRSSPHATD